MVGKRENLVVGYDVTRYDLLSLQFDRSSIEKAFNRDYLNNYALHRRLCHLYSIIFYVGFTIVVYFNSPELIPLYLFLSLGIVAPMFLLGFIFSYYDWYMRSFHLAAAFYIVLTGSGMIFMASISPGGLLWPYVFGIVLSYIFGYTFIRTRFLYATAAAWIVFVLYAVVLSDVLETNRSYYITTLILLAIVNILGMLVSYTIELSARKEFLLRLMLAQEGFKLANANKELLRLNQKLEEFSYSDALTLLANRRHFDERLKSDFSRAVRYGAVLTLVIIDIDFFKRYNDIYGHQAGDICLQKVAEVFRSVCKRPTDFVARYGGEEFALVFYNDSAQNIEKLCQEIQQRLSDEALIHPDSPIGNYVTLSMGIASIVPVSTNTAYKLINAADRALYLAKSNGRNRIEVSAGGII